MEVIVRGTVDKIDNKECPVQVSELLKQMNIVV
jgi:hypothetical protein